MTSEHTPAQGPITVTMENGQAPIVTTEVQPVVTSPIVEGNSPPPAPVAEVVPPVEPAVVADPLNPDPNAINKTTPEWAQKRINELTAKRYEAERTAKAETDRRIAAEKVNADLIARMGGAPVVDSATGQPTKPALTEDEIERRAVEKAHQIAAQTRFNEVCNNVADDGKKEFNDWDDALKNLGLVGALGQNVSPIFLETAIELKNPHKILHHLGKNLEEAERIAKLPPTKMAMEMARVEALLNAAPPPAAPPTPPTPIPVSNAPAPVIPVGGAAKPGTPDIYDPNIPMEDFYKMRLKQEDERKNRYRRA